MPTTKFIRFISSLAILILASSAFAQSESEDNLIAKLLQSRPDWFGEILKNVEKHEIQILYTQIDRDRNNRPSFRSYSYRVDSKEYFYPASTVKLPAAILALEKLNALGIKGLNKYTSLRIDSAYAGQTAVTHDSSAANYLPSIAHYVKKIDRKSRFFWSATMMLTTGCTNFSASADSMKRYGRRASKTSS